MRESKKNDIDKINKQIEYIYFSRAYLKLAYSGIINNPISIHADEENILEGYTERNFIVAPILYNIKHAIELFIKFIAKILDLDMGDKDFEKKHDIKLLFQKIKIKFNKISDDDVEKLEKLILKYHHLEFLNKKIENNFTIADKTNDVFRYPDNKANIDLDFGSIFNQFGEKDFEEIKKDIVEFKKLFFAIGDAILHKNDEVKELSEKNREKILNLSKNPKITRDELANELQKAFELQN